MTETVIGPGGVAFPAAAVKQMPEPLNRLGCAGCGGCCERLTLATSPADHLARQEMVLAWQADVAAGEKVERPHLPHPGDLAWTLQLEHLEEGPAGVHVYRCPKLDPISKLCTMGDERPPVCKGFPFYGRAPGEDSTEELAAVCSYQWDLPVELRAPLTGEPTRVMGPTGPVNRLIPLWPAAAT